MVSRWYTAAALGFVSTLVSVPVLAQQDDASERGSFQRTEERQPCADFEPLRRPFFGDTHVHTALSFDASGQDTRNLPADAYAFARGAPMRIQPYDADGVGMREIRLDRPLDFAAVTDHAEWLGRGLACAQTPRDPPGYDQQWLCDLPRRASGRCSRA